MVINVFNCDMVMIEESIDSKRKKEEYAYSIYVILVNNRILFAH
jgi:hypothetical protein